MSEVLEGPELRPEERSLEAQGIKPKNATKAELKIAAERELAERVLAKRKFMPFVKRMNPRYKAGWVHADIAERLERFSEAVARGESPRLMILMPPRHGKSELASRMFPAWHLGNHPEHEFIATSYSLPLALSFSRKVQETMDDPAYQSVFATRLNPNNRSAEAWNIQGEPGGYLAAGIGGGITGRGANCLVIDDPLKNAEEADSPDHREKIWEWYLSTAYSRLAPGGGVLVIQCMTGETPVLMADGTHRRLDQVRAGDRVATFEGGHLTTARVVAQRSSGSDSVLKITTTSGRVVRANGRHPFLVDTIGGLRWIRAKELNTTHRVVRLGSGGSGKASRAARKDASCLPDAEDCAVRTTTSRNGLMGTVRRLLTRSLDALRTSSIGTVLRWTSSRPCTLPSKVGAQSVGWLTLSGHPITGAVAYASTTATPRVAYGHSFATIATPRQGTSEMSATPARLPRICDFTTDGVLSVEPDGVEEVFDLQIERTQNFIANGLVSHNTWWHDDDLAGKMQQMMADAIKEARDNDEEIDPDVDMFEVVKYPAIAVEDEYLDEGTHAIVNEPGPFRRLLRRMGEALHPARYDIRKLNRIRRQNQKHGGADGRWWSALYQQNPVPDDGDYFTKDQFRVGVPPQRRDCYVFQAWDFAIEKKRYNDFTVGVTGYLDSDDVLWIVDLVRIKTNDTYKIVDEICNMAQRHEHPSLLIGFEDGQIWKTMRPVLEKEMKLRAAKRTGRYVPTEVLKPLTDKLVRARPLQGRMQSGKVCYAKGAPWYDAARTEMLRFPAGVHDDQVDAQAWLAQLTQMRAAPQKKKPSALASWRDRLGMDEISGTSHMAS